MRRQDAIDRLTEAAPAIRACGVSALYIFGSVARDESGDGSDLDVFVEPASPAFYDLANFMGAYDTVRGAVPNVQVGFSTRNGLSRFVREAVERDAIRVF
jgi:predicted nucleotidyltransferase